MINKEKFFLSLVLPVLLLFLTACSGADDRKKKYMEKGRQYFKSENYGKARVEFKNVLQIDPKYPEGYYYMGRVYESGGEYSRAISAYAKALELKPDYLQAKISSGRIYLWAKMTERALAFSSDVLDQQPASVGGLVVYAGAKFQQGDIEEALLKLRSALELAPDNTEAIALLSRVYITRKQQDKATALLISSLHRNPENKALRLLLVQIYTEHKQYEPALVEIKKMIEMYPEKINYRTKQALLYEARGDVDEVERVLRRAVIDFPDKLPAKTALIEFLSEKRDMMLAQLELSRFIKEDSSNADLKLISAQLYRKMENYDKAEKIYNTLITEMSDERVSVKAHTELSRLLIDTGREDTAVQELGKLLRAHPTNRDALLLRGVIALKRSRPLDAIIDFRLVIKNEPDNMQVIRRLVQAYTMAGEDELLEQQLRHGIEVDPLDMSIQYELARLEYQQARYSEAIALLEVVVKNRADAIEAKSLLLQACLSNKNFKRALEIAESVKRQNVDSPLGYYYYGIVLQAQGQYAQSIELFKDALQKSSLQKSSRGIQPLSSLVRSSLAMQKPDIAIDVLVQSVREMPQSPVIRNLLAEVYLYKKQFTSALSELEKAVSLKADWWVLYRNMASAHISLNQPEKAVKSYQRGIDNVSEAESSKLVLRLAQLYEGLGQIDNALARYEEMLLDQPTRMIASNNLARLLVNYRSDPPSMERALKLLEPYQQSTNAEVLDTLGWVYYKRGELDNALKFLLMAQTLSPETASISYHLGTVYYSRGETDQAIAYLESVLRAGEFKESDRVREMLQSMSGEAEPVG